MDEHQNRGPGLGPGRDPPGNYHPLTCPAAVSVDGDPEPTRRPRPVDPLMMHPKTASKQGQNLPYVDQPTALGPNPGAILEATAIP